MENSDFGVLHVVAHRVKELPIWQVVDIIFQSGIKYYIPKPLKVLLIHESLDPLNVSVIIPIDTFLNSLSSFISATYRDCIKKYTHTIPLSGKTTTTKKTKGVKIKFLPFPRQNKCPPSPHGSLPSSQANVHAHTHFHTNTRARCSHKWREREMLVREVSGLWLRPHHPHPARFTLPWTNEATISGVFIQVAIVQIHKVRNFFFALSPHNFWIFSATTMGFSLRNWAAAALR